MDRVLIQQLDRKFSGFTKTPKAHYLIHNSLSLVPILG
jgi:hypothetical protein